MKIFKKRVLQGTSYMKKRGQIITGALILIVVVILILYYGSNIPNLFKKDLIINANLSNDEIRRGDIVTLTFNITNPYNQVLDLYVTLDYDRTMWNLGVRHDEYTGTFFMDETFKIVGVHPNEIHNFHLNFEPNRGMIIVNRNYTFNINVKYSNKKTDSKTKIVFVKE